MDTETVRELTEIAKALAWPIVAIYVLINYGSEIRGLFP